MPPRPPIPPGPPTPAGQSGDPGGPGPIPGAPPKDRDKDDDKKNIPESLAGYGFDKDAVRAAIERHFRVYEERDALPGFDRALLVAFYVLAKKEEIEKKLPQLNDELNDLDPQIQPMLREEGGETLIVVARRPREERQRKSHLPLILAALTFLTLSAAGTIIWTYYAGERELSAVLQWENLYYGVLTFTLPLVFFFALQEVARRIVAARHHMKMRMSLIIPVPPILIPASIASFGSLSNPRGSPPNRKAMFDLGAAGPIAGFIAATIITLLGFSLTLSAGIVAPEDAELEMVVMAPGPPPDGTTWHEGDGGLFQPFERSQADEPHSAHNITIDFRVETAGRDYGHEGWQITIVPHGTGRDGVDYTLEWRVLGAGGELLAHNTTRGEITERTNVTVTFDIGEDARSVAATLEYHVPDRLSVPLNEPLFFGFLSEAFPDDRDDLLLHPTGLAGWTAFLLTGVMLLPVGRFDGGAIARAWLGERATILSYLAIAALAVLTLFYAGWIYLLLIIVLFLGVRHPMPLEDSTSLDPKRMIFTFLLIFVLLVSFVPLPTTLEGLGFLR